MNVHACLLQFVYPYIIVFDHTQIHTHSYQNSLCDRKSHKCLNWRRHSYICICEYFICHIYAFMYKMNLFTYIYIYIRAMRTPQILYRRGSKSDIKANWCKRAADSFVLVLLLLYGGIIVYYSYTYLPWDDDATRFSNIWWDG